MNQPSQSAASAATPERIFARQLASDLTPEEVEQVSGGMAAASTAARASMRAAVCTPASSTFCNDVDTICDC